MKFFAFIMAVLVLALSITPCADSENISKQTKAGSILVKQEQHTDDGEQDECSPFCYCTCCAGFSINYCITSIAIVSPYYIQSPGTYLSAHINEVSLPVWQPPQLG